MLLDSEKWILRKFSRSSRKKDFRNYRKNVADRQPETCHNSKVSLKMKTAAVTSRSSDMETRTETMTIRSNLLSEENRRSTSAFSQWTQTLTPWFAQGYGKNKASRLHRHGVSKIFKYKQYNTFKNVEKCCTAICLFLLFTAQLQSLHWI